MARKETEINIAILNFNSHLNPRVKLRGKTGRLLKETPSYVSDYAGEFGTVNKVSYRDVEELMPYVVSLSPASPLTLL